MVEINKWGRNEELLLLQDEILGVLDRKPFPNYFFLVLFQLLWVNFLIHYIGKVNFLGLRSFVTILFKDAMFDHAFLSCKGAKAVSHPVAPLT